MNQEEVSKLINLIFDIAFKERTPLEIIFTLKELPKEYHNIIAKTIMSRIQPYIK